MQVNRSPASKKRVSQTVDTKQPDQTPPSLARQQEINAAYFANAIFADAG
jgi:hypothetical protein